MGSRGSSRVAQLVAHNAAFDGPFLEAWSRRLRVRLPIAFRVLCTIQRAEWFFAETAEARPESLRLLSLCAHFGVSFSAQDAHEALADARAKRAQTASHVPKTILTKYDRIRGRRGEQAIFALRGPSCGHCDTAIPLQRRNQMIGTGQIEVCEACGVLLYATQ
jgi:hypothetical protein